MSLSLLITINVLADIALLGGLAYAMSRVSRLTPHVATIQAEQSSPAERSSLAEQQPASRREARSADVAHPDFARPRALMAHRPGAQAAAIHDSAA